MKKPMKKTLTALLIAILGYLLVCTAVTGLDYLDYLKTRKETELDTKFIYRVYSKEEIAKDPSLEAVRLYFFPAQTESRNKCVVYLPGGSYTSCNPYDVCVPAAAEAAEMKVNAFVLTYRVGDYTEDFMPVKDVAAGIRYLFDHAEALNIDMDGYMLTGFSAGGHLAGLFGSEELGYARYDVPKPGAIGLAYPLVNASKGFFESWNLVSDFINHHLRNNAVTIMLGEDPTEEEKASIDIQNCVTPAYPKVFMVQGEEDFLVRCEDNSKLLAKALRENGVLYDYRLYSGLTHGFGIGTGTKAEGWNRAALRFWQE